MTSLPQLLQKIIISSADDDMSSTIARYILEHINTLDVKALTVEKLADACFTSPASISRFVKQLGFQNFNDFRVLLIEHHASALSVIETNMVDLNFHLGDKYQVLESYTKLITRSLEDFSRNLDFDQLDQLCHSIHATERIYTFGTHIPGLLLEHLQYQFINMGKMIEFYQNRNDQLKVLNNLPENCLVLIFSGNGNFLKRIQPSLIHLTVDNCHSILVTQDESLKETMFFDEVFSLGKDKKEKGGRYKFQLFSELLVNRYSYFYPNKK